MYRPAKIAAFFGVASIVSGVVLFAVAQSRGVGSGGGVGVPGLRNPVNEIVYSDNTTQTTAYAGFDPTNDLQQVLDEGATADKGLHVTGTVTVALNDNNYVELQSSSMKGVSGTDEATLDANTLDFATNGTSILTLSADPSDLVLYWFNKNQDDYRIRTNEIAAWNAAAAAGGSTNSLQEVLDEGNTATSDMKVTGKVSIGTATIASGDYSFAGGNGSEASGESAMAFGENCIAAEWGVFAGGLDSVSRAGTDGSIVYGSTLFNDGAYNAIFGINNIVSNFSDGNIVGGRLNKIYEQADNNLVVGEEMVVSNLADYSVALGRRGHVLHSRAFVWAHESGSGQHFDSVGANTFNVQAENGFFLEGSIIPVTSNSWNLGAPTSYWTHIYCHTLNVHGSTIKIGAEEITESRIPIWDDVTNKLEEGDSGASTNLSDYNNDPNFITDAALADLSNSVAAVSNAVDAFTNVANVTMYFDEDVDNGVFQAAPGGGAPTAYQVISNWTGTGISDNFTVNTNGYVVVDTTGRYWVYFSGGVQSNDGDMEWGVFVDGSASVLNTIRETTGNDAGSVSCGGYLDLTAGSTVDVRVAWFDRTDRDLYMVKGQLAMGLQQSVAGGSVTEDQIALWNKSAVIDTGFETDWQSTNEATWLAPITNVSTAPFDGFATLRVSGYQNGAYGGTPPGHTYAVRFTTNTALIDGSYMSNAVFLSGDWPLNLATRYECTEGDVYTNRFEMYLQDLVSDRTQRVWNLSLNVEYGKELP